MFSYIYIYTLNVFTYYANLFVFKSIYIYIYIYIYIHTWNIFTYAVDDILTTRRGPLTVPTIVQGLVPEVATLFA